MVQGACNKNFRSVEEMDVIKNVNKLLQQFMKRKMAFVIQSRKHFLALKIMYKISLFIILVINFNLIKQFW